MSRRTARRSATNEATVYVSPLARHLALWGLFLGLVVVSIFTVLKPELQSETPEPHEDAAEAAAPVERT